MDTPVFNTPVKDVYLYCVSAQKTLATSVEVSSSTMLQVFPEIQTGDSIYKFMKDFAYATFPIEGGWHSHSLVPHRLTDSFIQQYFRTTPLKRKRQK